MSECINLVCDQYTKPLAKDIVHEMRGEAADIAIKGLRQTRPEEWTKSLRSGFFKNELIF